MKAAIFSFITCSEKSMVASVKAAFFLSKTLNLPLVDDETIELYETSDVLFIVNGAYAFCKHLEPLSHAIRGVKRIVWIQQDYTIVPPINDGDATSPFRKAFVDRRKAGKSHLEFWTTCEKESRLTSLSSLINWNALGFEEEKPPLNKKDAGDLFYYGSFRAGRTKAFDKFFNSPSLPITISSPTSRFEQKYSGPNVRHVKKIEDLHSELGRHGLGLYLEDAKSHSNFHSPPNRFYEMLSGGLPMVFQEEAGYTLRKAGYDPGDFLVSNAASVQRRMSRRAEILKEQQDRWWLKAAREKRDLKDKVLEAYNRLEKNL